MITYENECPFCLQPWDKTRKLLSKCKTCTSFRDWEGAISLKIGAIEIMWAVDQSKCCFGTSQEHDGTGGSCIEVEPALPFDIDAIKIAIAFS